MTELRVRKPDGWTTVSFPEEVGTISVAGGKVDGQLCLTLTGEREGGPGIVETVFFISPPPRDRFSHPWDSVLWSNRSVTAWSGSSNLPSLWTVTRLPWASP
ncbi:hypothetical protein E6P14_02880 (plasmid) [Haloarcula marismortui ATCC 43049]|uniref:Uncharacterized protein n=1 Tax=Haloarcula marismortui (strain ATCC 43049 / DSM 3752 / JCM 8966 / VKM B-1809) TaxID=272569 RepID=A0A4V1ELQ2_HALMA|nr:hypothetical protein E6P14_02880 [Haloarcula marismortui ATCC 43049]